MVVFRYSPFGSSLLTVRLQGYNSRILNYMKQTGPKGKKTQSSQKVHN